MALHIRDPETESAVRKLAELRGSNLTDAVRAACEEAISRERRKLPLSELVGDLQAEMQALARTGKTADKAYFDELWGEKD